MMKVGDVSTGDGKDKRFKRKYSLQIREYANQALTESELNVYKEIFGEIVDKNALVEAQDIMLADLMCFDYLRAKRLQKFLKEKGDT